LIPQAISTTLFSLKPSLRHSTSGITRYDIEKYFVPKVAEWLFDEAKHRRMVYRDSLDRYEFEAWSSI
jgi:hypothetical protein